MPGWVTVFGRVNHLDPSVDRRIEYPVKAVRVNGHIA